MAIEKDKNVNRIFTEEQQNELSKTQYEALKLFFPESRQMKVRVTWLTPALGMSPNDKDILAEFIASKAPDAKSREEEIAAVGTDAVEEKSITVFPRNEAGNPCCWDYQWRGYFKDSCGLLSRAAGKDANGKKKGTTKSAKMTAYKKVIDGSIMTYPRMIEVHLPEGEEMGMRSRSLRCETAQGPRNALAKSEELPVGTYAEFYVVCLNPSDCDVVEEWLNYGCLHGFSQWRNAGFGCFKWEKLEDWTRTGDL